MERLASRRGAPPVEIAHPLGVRGPRVRVPDGERRIGTAEHALETERVAGVKTEAIVGERGVRERLDPVRPREPAGFPWMRRERGRADRADRVRPEGVRGGRFAT